MLFDDTLNWQQYYDFYFSSDVKTVFLFVFRQLRDFRSYLYNLRSKEVRI